ncbi:hypothetical protein HDU76_005946, partial [Blyttiomyces sp. JEL0837]
AFSDEKTPHDPYDHPRESSATIAAISRSTSIPNINQAVHRQSNVIPELDFVCVKMGWASLRKSLASAPIRHIYPINVGNKSVSLPGVLFVTTGEQAGGEVTDSDHATTSSRTTALGRSNLNTSFEGSNVEETMELEASDMEENIVKEMVSESAVEMAAKSNVDAAEKTDERERLLVMKGLENEGIARLSERWEVADDEGFVKETAFLGEVGDFERHLMEKVNMLIFGEAVVDERKFVATEGAASMDGAGEVEHREEKMAEVEGTGPFPLGTEFKVSENETFDNDIVEAGDRPREVRESEKGPDSKESNFAAANVGELQVSIGDDSIFAKAIAVMGEAGDFVKDVMEEIDMLIFGEVVDDKRPIFVATENVALMGAASAREHEDEKKAEVEHETGLLALGTELKVSEKETLDNDLVESGDSAREAHENEHIVDLNEMQAVTESAAVAVAVAVAAAAGRAVPNGLLDMAPPVVAAESGKKVIAAHQGMEAMGRYAGAVDGSVKSVGVPSTSAVTAKSPPAPRETNPPVKTTAVRPVISAAEVVQTTATAKTPVPFGLFGVPPAVGAAEVEGAGKVVVAHYLMEVMDSVLGAKVADKGKTVDVKEKKVAVVKVEEVAVTKVVKRASSAAVVVVEKAVTVEKSMGSGSGSEDVKGFGKEGPGVAMLAKKELEKAEVSAVEEATPTVEELLAKIAALTTINARLTSELANATQIGNNEAHVSAIRGYIIQNLEQKLAKFVGPQEAHVAAQPPRPAPVSCYSSESLC